VRVELPIVDGAQTMIAGVELDGALSMRAIALSPFTRPDLLPDVGEGRARVYVVHYRETLEQLELDEGVLESTDDPRFARPLPATFASAQYVDVRDLTTGEWIPLEDLDPQLDAFRFRARREVCAAFDARLFDFGTDELTSAIVALDEHRVLALPSDSSAAFIVTATAEERLPPLPIREPYGAFRAADGKIWIGGAFGELWFGTSHLELERAPPSPSGAIIRWIDGPRGNEPFELFIVTQQASFERFDGVNWEILVPPRAETVETNRGGVAWLAEGYAIAVPPQKDAEFDAHFLVYDARTNPRVTKHHIDTSAIGLPANVEHVDGLGAVMLTRLSTVLRFTGTVLERFERGPGLSNPLVITRFRDGFFTAGEGIGFSQWMPLVGFCPDQSVVAPLLPLASAPLETGLVLTGDTKPMDVPKGVVLIPR
jgi:hypothetical protein